MIDKRFESCAAAVADIHDGASIMIGGFGEAGSPLELVHALIDQGAKQLTVISNNAGNGLVGLAALLAAGRVAKIICSFPRSSHCEVFARLYRAKTVQLELGPQGTLAERIRAAGAGIGAFYTPTGAHTELAQGKETRVIDGRSHVLEFALAADFALVKCERADPAGNLTFNKTARNFNPIMCMAAATSIVQARVMAELGGIDPEHVVTPGIFVDRLVCVPSPQQEGALVERGEKYRC